MSAKRKISARKVTKKKAAKAPAKHPLIGVLMGSESDLKWMQEASDALTKFKIPHEVKVISAHRTPSALSDYATTASARGIRVIIAGAGGAAHLPGMLAANTILPVIGVPCPIGPLQGQDAILSIVQMPRGVPVATVAIGGGWNAGVLATQILASGDGELAKEISARLSAYKDEMADLVKKMDANIS